MSLKKKIALSFFISAFIIALLAAFEYVNFIEIKKEIRNLEITDTIRSKSLQLRRHEKNFFLNGDLKELTNAYNYVRELKDIIGQSSHFDRTGRLLALKNKIIDYEKKLNRIENIYWDFQREFNAVKPLHAQYAKFFPLIEATFLERPVITADVLEGVFLLQKGRPVLKNLYQLDAEITELRKSGEEIINISKELDRIARERAENTISLSQVAILVFFPLFLLVGIGTLFYITSTVVKRLAMVIEIVERTGKGHFSQVSMPAEQWGKDEIGVLIRKFNAMEEELVEREEELETKNKELLLNKKLAAIGTLASGVAHELNNPLNNIYLSAQVLQREAGDSCSPFMKETLGDIIGQSIRVKGIVGDLLEYARGKAPSFRTIELNELIRNIYKLLKITVNMQEVHLVLNSNEDRIYMNADQEQIERVFINLFTNAVEAMGGKGDIIVTLSKERDAVKIWVSDTGKGMTPEEMEKVFEPFFTTKDKGTGLGLAIVFNIIKKHGGEIFVDSQKEKGTTFYMVFPGGKDGI
jgi:two-component system NtrC family sensor kinase